MVGASPEKVQNEQAHVPVKMEGGAPGVPCPDLPPFSEYGQYGYHLKGDVGGYSGQLFLFDFGTMYVTLASHDLTYRHFQNMGNMGIILKGMSVATLAK